MKKRIVIFVLLATILFSLPASVEKGGCYISQSDAVVVQKF